MKRELIEPVAIAAEKAGGICALAGQLGIKHQSLYDWKQIPIGRVGQIADITGIPRAKLRPDVYSSDGGNAA